MSVTAPTRPTLLSIEQGDRIIRFTERGKRHEGIVSTIRPHDAEALQRAIDMVNQFGGPNAWSITEVTECERGTGQNAVCGQPAVDYLDFTAVCADHAKFIAWAEAHA